MEEKMRSREGGGMFVVFQLPWRALS